MTRWVLRNIAFATKVLVDTHPDAARRMGDVVLGLAIGTVAGSAIVRLLFA